MQISLRSQLVAGTTALVGATAIAMTPIAPAVSLPSLSPTKAAVTLAAFDNPFNALTASLAIGVNYFLSPTSTTPYAASLWPGSGVDAVANGIARGLGVSNVGLISQFLAAPFPVATQLASNWLGYANQAVVAGGAVLAAASTLAWIPVNLGGTIISDVLSGNIANIPNDITDAINASLDAVTTAFNVAVAQVTSIVNTVVARATAVVDLVTGTLPTLLNAVAGQAGVLVAAVQNVFNQTIAGFTEGGTGFSLSGGWNAAVAGLLGPGNMSGLPGAYGLSIPGAVANILGGAGVGAGADFVPSVRTVASGVGAGLAYALSTPVVPPVAAVRGAAAKTAAAVPADTAPSSAAAAAPAKKSPAAAGARRAAAAKAAAAK